MSIGIKASCGTNIFDTYFILDSILRCQLLVFTFTVSVPVVMKMSPQLFIAT